MSQRRGQWQAPLAGGQIGAERHDVLLEVHVAASAERVADRGDRLSDPGAYARQRSGVECDAHGMFSTDDVIAALDAGPQTVPNWATAISA